MLPSEKKITLIKTLTHATQLHRVVMLLLVQGAEGVSSGVLKWSSSHTHTTDPSSSATLLAGQGKHSCCLEDIL